MFGILCHPLSYKVHPNTFPSNKLIDLFVVAPTGIGKGLAISVATMLHSKISIVIVPTVALLADLSKRFRTAGHKVFTTTSDVNDDAQCIVSHENIASFQYDSTENNLESELRSSVMILLLPEDVVDNEILRKNLVKIKDSIQTVYYDEAQLIVKWRFRKYLESILFFKGLSDSIQLVFLSGTFPLHFESIFKNITNLNYVKFIRYPCDRPDIGFYKMKVEDGDFSVLIDKALEILESLSLFLNDKKVLL
jgi:superfamily II DNA helicase RecQ